MPTKLFSDTWTEKGLSSKFSEHSNSLAIVAGIATEEQRKHILKELIENKSRRLVPAVTFMHYVIESVFMSGQGQQAISMLKDRYRHMQQEGTETLWEEWGLTVSKKSGVFTPNGSRSVAQGENTFIAYSLTKWVLGIQLVKPGMAKVKLSCNLCGNNEIKGSMPTPKGEIKVAWKKLSNGISLDVVVPEGIKAYVNIKDMNLKKNAISMDKIVQASLGTELHIPEGRHIINFQ